MAKTRLYIARHGKTMFNTIGRVQGWSDTPLTRAGEEGIRELGLGLKEAGVEFKRAVSSDLGRTVQTITIAQRELGILGKIPYYQDKRIREWCFGSYEGMYDEELFSGVLPRITGVTDDETFNFEQIAEGVYQADSAGWAEPWDQLKERILSGFTAIAQEVDKAGGGNALVVSHGMTIATLAWLLSEGQRMDLELENGSVTLVSYENGRLQLETVGDLSYRMKGKERLENASKTL
ncbi:histidine phosphatase family protein [Streptococcus sp. DD13]|uniref:histidine phosphatase family protein n=1 Tax=Streptococcus sp. DD13 TaxID=1777881 RepID=UPI00079AD076|nr:histidine phosphatase family protein [Streptococcus sp. DD13]KXT78022.1 Phosphoglycerate mutase family [Streptococcus sp. DD13]